MIILGIIILICFLITLILFAFPQFSPIPYFPSNKKDLPLIIDALDIKNDQVILDMGAGDGVIIFEAAKYAYDRNLNTQFIAIDINPILVGIMLIRRHFHPHKQYIKIRKSDMFTLDISKILPYKFNHATLYAYISPRYLEHIVALAKKVHSSNTSIVSYFYSIPSLKVTEKKTSGIHGVYTYKI
jgi:SAM-dependent methyltransferase